MDSGGGSNAGLAGGEARGGGATGKSPPHRSGRSELLAMAVEPVIGAGTSQAASPRGTRLGGVENLQELSRFDLC